LLVETTTPFPSLVFFCSADESAGQAAIAPNAAVPVRKLLLFI
jgi:hypothetical protein